MLITKKSQITGYTHTQELNITNEQIDAWQQGTLIQDAMPDLSPDEREFLMTGITAKEWTEAFGETHE